MTLTTDAEASTAATAAAKTPRITSVRVIPVAGRDSMLLNLSGAHAPFFTRNLLILTDSAGRTGVAEVPGASPSARRWKTHALSSTTPAWATGSGCSTKCAPPFRGAMPADGACRRLICAPPSTRSRRWKPPFSTCSASTWRFPSARCWVKASSAAPCPCSATSFLWATAAKPTCPTTPPPRPTTRGCACVTRQP